jgi:hypothetical protein
MLLDFVCYYFIEDFCIFVCKRYGSYFYDPVMLLSGKLENAQSSSDFWKSLKIFVFNSSSVQ